MKKLCITFIVSLLTTHFTHPAKAPMPPKVVAPATVVAPAPVKVTPKVVAPMPPKVAIPAPVSVAPAKAVIAAPVKVVVPVPTSPARLYNVLIKNTSVQQGSLTNITINYSLNKKTSSVQIPIPASPINPKSNKKDILIKTLPFNVPTGAGILGISELTIDGQSVKIKYKNQSWHPGLLTDAMYVTKLKGSWKLDKKAMDTAYKNANTPVGLQKTPTTTAKPKVTQGVKAATTAIIHSNPKKTSKKVTKTVKPKKSKSSKAAEKAAAIPISKPTIA